MQTPIMRRPVQMPRNVHSKQKNSQSLHEIFILNADNTKPPSYFNSGSRLGQIYHARLRTHCSSFNEHLFTKNIVDSPLCVCGKVENTHHYLFDCTRYDDLRREFLNAVFYYCEPTVNTILFGNSALTSTQNQNIFIAVQDYLIKSKRFQVN